MKDRACRNCGSNERYSQEVDARGGEGPNLLPIGFWTWGKLEIRVCGRCGLVDWFVPERFVSKVKEKFTRVL
jgi:predicted nucleic-acid-binding Zn-ribbon protein